MQTPNGTKQSARTCIKCGASLPPSAPTGRPATYCSTACRRAAELEIRRLNRHIEKIEERMAHIRIHGRSSYACYLREPDAAIDALKCECERHESRLRLLLSEQREEA